MSNAFNKILGACLVCVVSLISAPDGWANSTEQAPQVFVQSESAPVDFFRILVHERSECSITYALYPAGGLAPQIFTLRKPGIFYGDLVIDSNLNIADFACIKTVTGSVKFEDGIYANVGLPALERIGGDLTIVYDQESDNSVAEQFDLPLLSRVEGSVHLLSQATDSYLGVRFNLGLPSLSFIGADLSIDIDAFSIEVSGLIALHRVMGNLKFNGGNQDGFAFDFLSNLKVVKGDANIHFGGSGQHNFFNALETVGGDLNITRGTLVQDDNGFGEANFKSLRKVSGSIRLEQVDLVGTEPVNLFGQLSYAGSLQILNSSIDMPFAVSGQNVLVAGLYLFNNSWLTDLTTQLNGITYTQDSAIEIVNNKNLLQCQAEAWVAQIAEHIGMVSIDNNQPCLAEPAAEELAE